ncbi:MAG: 3-phosphoglycerate dehydrogenase [Clostridiales bacterium]|nr:3-phosphoglycerate dehydrogenase [Clostridiales bacterium]
MFTIKTLNAISNVIYDVLDDKYAVSADAENYDAVIVRSASMHEMELPDSLVSIARAGAGYNNIPVDKCTEKGIVVYNTPGANANAVAELALGLMITASRNVMEGAAFALTLKGNGDQVGPMAEKGKSKFVGGELLGKKLAVIGLGAVGGKVANMGVNMGMKVTGHDPFLSVDAAWALSTGVKKAASIAEAVEGADFISFHVPLINDTRGYINAEMMANMKDGAIILNLSRGELANNEDIMAALDSGKLKKYVTDFSCEELLGYKNVISLPHLGASTPESEDNCATMAAAQTAAYLETGSIVNSVNFPALELAPWEGVRVCVLHKNVPAMITRIAGAFGEAHINIEHMINKSKKDAAYTVLDIDAGADVEKAAKVAEGIESVYRVRVIR